MGLDDLRTDCGEVDLIDESSGELLRTVPAPIAVVSDKGPCFRRAVLAEAPAMTCCCATSAPGSRASLNRRRTAAGLWRTVWSALATRRVA